MLVGSIAIFGISGFVAMNMAIKKVQPAMKAFCLGFFLFIIGIFIVSK
jgi:hypothetical protein